MRRIRLYADMSLSSGQTITLPPEAAEHAVRVLRLGAGDTVVLFNGDGCDYEAELVVAERRRAEAVIRSVTPVAMESPLHITLAQSVVRGDKMDLVVQKATELGATRIVPLLTERGEIRLNAERGEKRLTHWQAVVRSACEQCGRAQLPQVDEPARLESWLAGLDEEGMRLALLPEAEVGLSELALPSSKVTLVVGPEGGLGERDVAALQAAGFRGLRLGPRVLRTETAGLAALAALQARFGDF